MTEYMVFLIGLTIVGVCYVIYEIVDRICRYKERTHLYGREDEKE